VRDEGDEVRLAADIPTLTRTENRFTTVEEEERRRQREERDAERAPVALQTAVLVACLLGLLGAAWYFTRPPSAESLAARIDEAAADEKPDRLIEVDDDVASFLERFPDHPRAARIRTYQEEIELLEMERRFQRRSRLLVRDESLLPIERDYIEAVNYLPIEPEKSRERLGALLALYDPPPEDDPGEIAAQVLELARRQLKRLDKQSNKLIPQYLELIDRNLAHAEELRRSEPARARAIWQGIIRLYSDKPWAASRIAAARRELDATTRHTAEK
jgi:serine/threonine-protein kinase